MEYEECTEEQIKTFEEFVLWLTVEGYDFDPDDEGGITVEGRRYTLDSPDGCRKIPDDEIGYALKDERLNIICDPEGDRRLLHYIYDALTGRVILPGTSTQAACNAQFLEHAGIIASSDPTFDLGRLSTMSIDSPWLRRIQAEREVPQ